MKYVSLLALIPLLLTTACSEGKRIVDKPVEPLRFVHPRSTVSLTGGEIPVQVWVQRHPDNRAVRISWDGVGCNGSSTKSMDGQYEAAVQPPMAPLKVRMTPGVCTITAEVLGPGGKLRHRTFLEMRICGPEGCGNDR